MHEQMRSSDAPKRQPLSLLVLLLPPVLPSAPRIVRESARPVSLNNTRPLSKIKCSTARIFSMFLRIISSFHFFCCACCVAASSVSPNPADNLSAACSAAASGGRLGFLCVNFSPKKTAWDHNTVISTLQKIFQLTVTLPGLSLPQILSQKTYIGF